MTKLEVGRTYLELRARDDLRPVTAPTELYEITREAPCPAELSRALYRAVGRVYNWRDRDAWTEAQLASYLARPEVAVHVMREEGNPAGYFELMRHEDGSVEIVLFGLVPAAQGRGLGKWLLARAVDEAWAMGANRVWLHTCTLDSPAALPNYQARGFVPYRTETYTVEVAVGGVGVSGRGGASG